MHATDLNHKATEVGSEFDRPGCPGSCTESNTDLFVQHRGAKQRSAIAMERLPRIHQARVFLGNRFSQGGSEIVVIVETVQCCGGTIGNRCATLRTAAAAAAGRRGWDPPSPDPPRPTPTRPDLRPDPVKSNLSQTTCVVKNETMSSLRTEVCVCNYCSAAARCHEFCTHVRVVTRRAKS